MPTITKYQAEKRLFKRLGKYAIIESVSLSSFNINKTDKAICATVFYNDPKLLERKNTNAYIYSFSSDLTFEEIAIEAENKLRTECCAINKTAIKF